MSYRVTRINRKPVTPLPYEKVALLGMILAANNTSIWMIFSFLPFMVEYYFPFLTKAELGYYAGILGSAFSGGSLIGNVLWGVVSDRYGRRPALLLGLTGTAVCALAFGFAPTFWFAVSFRFLWGLLNGNVGVAKTYLAEVSDDTNSANGMALFGVIGGFGRTIGPVIGGFLSSPAQLYPHVFSHTIFETFPYALPALIISANCMIVLLVSFLFLPETVSFLQLNSIAISNSADRSGNKSGYSLLASSEDNDEAFEDIDNEKSTAITVDSPLNGGKNGTAIEMSKLVALVIPRKVFLNKPLHSALPSRDDKTQLIKESQFLIKDDENDVEEGLLTGGRGFDEVKNELIPFQDLDKLNSNTNNSNNNSNRIDMSDVCEGENDSSKMLGSSEKRRKQKNRLTFNGVVEMKVIGSEKIVYSTLKVKEKEQPIIDFRDHSNDDDDEEGGRERGFSDGSDSSATLKSSIDDDGTLSDSFKQKKIRYSNGSEDYFDENNQLSVPTSRSFLSKLGYLLRRKEILISTLLYGTNALTMIATNEIFPLWVVTPRSLGGFEFHADNIGMSTMVCGVVSVILQITFYPKLVQWFGTLGTYKLCTICYAIGAFIAPMISLLNHVESPAVQWIGIITAQILLTVPASFVLVTVFVFINNSCYSQYRATVNGIGQTFASLGRLTGPYLAATLFAWSETNHMTWPFNYYFTFYIVGFITLMNWYLAIFLPRSIERRKREPTVDFMKHPIPRHPNPATFSPTNPP